MRGRVLSVAGSDCGGGAGIQADIKTITALKGYAMSAITALTVQDTTGVHRIIPVSPNDVADQMRVVIQDLGVDAIKTGMLGDEGTVHAVCDVLESQGKTIPLVVDPVMVAKGGASLLEEGAVTAVKRRLFPLASIVTPNLPEAETLIGTFKDPQMALKALVDLGAQNVLLKGGHGNGDTLEDLLLCDGVVHRFVSDRIDTRHTHGTGCTLSSAIATYLAQGDTMLQAVAKGHAYVRGAILNAPGYGHGHGPLNHGYNVRIQTD